MNTSALVSAIESGLEENLRLVQHFLKEAGGKSTLAELSERIAQSFREGQKVLICGNGGSACDAMHFAEEFTGRFRQARKALPVISLTDTGHLTCVANDMGFEEVFARGVEAFGKEGDWLILLSTSGNSPNVIRAWEAAQSRKMNTLSLLGKNGGKLAGKAHYEIVIPGKTADRIQEVHMLLLHLLIEMVERQLFPENY